ncbi:histidine kinase [Pedobacter sp. JCM 36344]|uniref:sensor histidine kinase n=1 Tax=Pedobacter sp. JCM 36344 TaxID=3374280 RepID=UPI0039785F5F
MADIVELEINNKNRLVYFTRYRWIAHVVYWTWVLVAGTLLTVKIPITPAILFNHFILDNLLIAVFFYTYCLYLIPYFFKRNKNFKFWSIVLACYFMIPAIDVMYNKNFVHLSTHQTANSSYMISYASNLGNYLLNFLIFSMMLFFMEKNEEGHTDMEMEKEQQEIERVKLDMLKTNISPDFLMRSLSQLKQSASDMAENTSEAILTFSDLLRYRLYSNRQQYTKLIEEMGAIYSFIHFIDLNKYNNNLTINLQTQGDPGDKSIAPLALVNIMEPFCKVHSNQPVTLSMILLIEDQSILLEMDYSLRANPVLLADLQEYGDNYKQLYGSSVKFHFENCEDERCLISLTLPVD